MNGDTTGVVAVVLAGGHGRRMGGDKATVLLAGRPLIAYPLEVLGACGFDEVVVVAKQDTVLPALDPAPARWVEPTLPRHPLTGIVHALRTAAGRPVFACAADMPLLDAATVHRVCAAAEPADLAVVPRAEGRLQPLCALYAPAALRALQHFELRPLTALVEALHPRVVELEDPTPCFNVNAPEDLLRAGTLRASRT